MMKKIILFVIVFFISACAGKGVYHEVKKGETLYRISKSYGTSSRHIARVNRIKNPAKIKEGDRLWIPGTPDRVRVASSPDRVKKSYENKKAPEKKAAKKKTEKTYPDVNISFVWPVSGKVINAYGSEEDEIHDGIDISAAKGSPVKAAAGGKIIYSGSEIKSYGKMVIIKHDGAYSTIYAHNSENKVTKGQEVKAGDVIASVGGSGHRGPASLHFEIRKGKDAVDPLRYLPK